MRAPACFADPRAGRRPRVAAEGRATDSATYPAGLTAREAEVLRLVAEGLSNAEVAERHDLSPRTVNGHLTAIYGKLGVASRSAAVRFALDHGRR